MTRCTQFACALALGVAAATPVKTDEAMTMHLAQLDRAYVVVQFDVPRNSDNRALVVSVEAPGYYRNSQIQLDGVQSARANTFELRDLPAEVCVVRGTLIGANGTRAETLQLVRVMPRASAKARRTSKRH